MKIIGVTGKLGSGKSFVANELSFNTKNSTVLEVDYIRNKLFKVSKSRDAIALRKKISHTFDIDVTTEYVWLDYFQFYQKLFSDYNYVQLCANIMTPYIKKRIKKELITLQGKGISCVYLPWAYLIEHDYLDIVNEVIFVTCQEDLVLRRAELSPHFDPLEAKRRRSIEPSDTERISNLISKNIPYKIIDNSHSIAHHIEKGTFING